MPNNSFIWEKPHLNWRSCFDLCSCIKSSYHHECALHKLYSCYLLCFSRCCYVSVDRGVEVQQSSSTCLYYLCSNKARRISPSLCIPLDLCFPPNIFTHNIAFDSKVFWADIRVSYQLHKYLIPLPVSIPIIHRIVVMAWVNYICCILMLRPA